MSLMNFPPDFAYCSHNLASTPVTVSFGAAVTAGASSADGSSVSILSALAHDCEQLVLGFSGFGTAGTGINPSSLLDILIDPAGGTTWATDPLIEDLLVGGTLPVNLASSTQGMGTPLWYFFPLWVPAGASLGARARTKHTSNITTGRVVVYAMGGNRNPASRWCGQKVTSFGITAASSRGTEHTPGSAGSYSSWANLGSPLSIAGRAYQWAVQGEDSAIWNAATTNTPYYFQFGVDSVQVGPPIVRGINANETGCSFPTGALFRTFEAGQQLMVRATCGGTAIALDCAAYIVS